MTWLEFLGYLTGLGFVSTDLDMPTLIRTAVIVNICNAIMCRVIARNNNMNPVGWPIAGFFFGFWAIGAALLVAAKRDQSA